MRRTCYGVLALTAALFLGGCDNDIEDLPTPTTPVTTTDTFTGTITTNGSATHTFPVVATGTVTATLTEILPDPTVAVGFIMGTWNGTVCQRVLLMDAAIQGNTLTGNTSGVGTLCVSIYDNGRLTGPIDYKLTVVHP